MTPWSERLVPPAWVILVLVAAGAADAKRQPCPDGRYLTVGGDRLITDSDASRLEAVEIAGSRLTLSTGCHPARMTQTVSRRGTRIVARLSSCPTTTGVLRLRARISSDCLVLQGTVRHKARGRRQSFVAFRSLCGDAVLDVDGGEQCDGNDVSGRTCSAVGGQGGALRCRPNCTLDLSGCQICGNDQRQGTEVCDGTDLAGESCPNGGPLLCRPDCLGFDARGCWVCGNGVREGTEACDGSDLGGATCNAPGETGGPLGCRAGCQLDRTECYRCGNFRLDPGEQCDDGNQVSGDGCSATCQSECGDGIVEGTEQCDDGNREDGDGCSAVCLIEAPYGGGGGESIDLCFLQWSVVGVAPAGVVRCHDGDPQCDRGATAGSCTFQYSFCFNVGQLTVGGPTPCRPTDIASVLVGADATLAAPDVEAFLAAASGTLARHGSTVSRMGDTLTVSPPTRRGSLCAGATLTVPAGENRVLAVEAQDSHGTADDDALTFTCDP